MMTKRDEEGPLISYKNTNEDVRLDQDKSSAVAEG